MAITAGFSYSCTNNGVGGISKLYLANASSIASYTYTSGSAELATLAMVGSEKFYLVTGMDDTITFTETAEVTNNKIVYKPEIKVQFGPRSKAIADFLNQVKACDRFCAIMVDNSAIVAKGWATGFVPGQGLRFMAGNVQTGANVTEDSMTEMTLGHPFGMMSPTAPLISSYTIAL